MTHTVAKLDVTRRTFDEIKDCLERAGYQHTFMHDGCIDLTGIALAAKSDQPTEPGATPARAALALPPSVDAGWQPIGVLGEIAAERRRQVKVDGWTEAHDDKHEYGELAQAAAAYATNTEHRAQVDVFAERAVAARQGRPAPQRRFQPYRRTIGLASQALISRCSTRTA